MSTIRYRMLSRAAAVVLTIVGSGVGAGAVLAASAGPAMAICRYGSPNCVNPRPNFDYVYQAPPTLEGTINDWINQDCAYYNNCGAPPQDDNDDDEEDDDAETRGASAGSRAVVAPRTNLRAIFQSRR